MKSPLEPDQNAVLQRYREQDGEQPSAALDARILAAARQAVEARRVSLPARFGRWLRTAGAGRRGALAFGSLASMALALALVWQTSPQRPGALHQPVAALPAGTPSSRAADEAQAAMAAPSPVSRPAAPLVAVPARRAESVSRSAQVEAAGVLRERSEFARPAAAAEPAQSASAGLDDSLREVLRMRAEGREDAAAQRLQALQREHPWVALQQRLEALEKEQALHERRK